MKKIGNIVFDKTFEDNMLFNLVDCMDSIVQSTKPTLIVGWSKVKSLYSDASIIDWSISDNIYWCFGKREKRNRYEETVNKFKQLAIKNFISGVKYSFIDIFLCDIECKKFLFELITGEHGKTVSYIRGDMLYINVSGDDCVYGLNLSDVDYEGKSRSNIISTLKNNKDNTIIDKIPYSIINMFSNTLYVIPYLYS